MAIKKITYEDKVSNDGQTDEGMFFSADANEIKAAVNSNADILSEQETQINNMIANRVPIPVTGDDLNIDWQNDIVPNDPYGRSYVGRFSNIIQGISGLYLNNGKYENYTPNFEITMNGSIIESVTIKNIFEGTISII